MRALQLEPNVPTVAGVGNAMRPVPDRYTPLRMAILHNLLPTAMAVTATLTQHAPVEVHNINGGKIVIPFDHYMATDALRLLMSEVLRGGLATQHAQHALNNIHLRPGESLLTGHNRLLQIFRAARADPFRTYLSEEPYFWMAITERNLYNLFDRAIALCCPGHDDRHAFRGQLIGITQNNNALLQQFQVDAHALGSAHMQQRGQLTRRMFHQFATLLGNHSSLFRPAAAPDAGSDSVRALRTSKSLRLPQGEDSSSLQTKSQGEVRAMRPAADYTPRQDYPDSPSDEDDGPELAAFTHQRGGASATLETPREPSARRPSRSTGPRGPDRRYDQPNPDRRRLDCATPAARYDTPAGGSKRATRDHDKNEARETHHSRPSERPASSRRVRFDDATVPPELPEDAPARDAEPRVIQEYIKCQGVCFHHARGQACQRMTTVGHCRYNHAMTKLALGSYPRPPALAAVGDLDENDLYDSVNVLTALIGATSPPPSPADVSESSD